MKAYRLFIHYNFGASSFTDNLIKRITDALEKKGILDSILSPDWEICWQGEPGEELMFHSMGFCRWDNDHNDMVELSKQFTKCQFCLRSCSDALDDVTDSYYYKGQWEFCKMEEVPFPHGNVW